ncbi:MAG: LysM peptidoglycan-binding domain-containing protein [Verrucomicrobia bacterium]|nr:LysM peptidoglycan-binding domain-containing protein [Verrucomicrobiota bacterium]
MVNHRSLVLLVSVALSLLPSLAAAQESSESIAARQAMQDAMRTMHARIEDLEASNHSLRAKVEDMRREIQQLREETRKLGDQSSLQDQMRKLGESVREVDNKRRADNEKVVAEFARLAKLIAETPVPSPAPVVKSSPPPTAPSSDPEPKVSSRPPVPEKGIEYVVKSGDTLSGIVAAARSKELKITMKQLRDANPDINWDRLRVGQKVFIPLPNQ